MDVKRKKFEERCINLALAVGAAVICAGRRLRFERSGQGTTEYAILVGVLVVIAIIAVVAFRDNLETLWNSVSENINSL